MLLTEAMSERELLALSSAAGLELKHTAAMSPCGSDYTYVNRVSCSAKEKKAAPLLNGSITKTSS